MCKIIMEQKKHQGWNLQILVEAIFYKNQLYKTNLGLRQTNKTFLIIEIGANLVRMARDQLELGVPVAN